MNRPYANAIAPVGYRGHLLMIEVNKRCYMDEAKLCKHDGFVRCHERLERAYSTLLKSHAPTAVVASSAAQLLDGKS